MHDMQGNPRGFNPCCIGLAIAAATPSPNDFMELGFQSLLYWISHCGSTKEGYFVTVLDVSILVVLD